MLTITYRVNYNDGTTPRPDPTLLESCLPSRGTAEVGLSTSAAPSTGLARPSEKNFPSGRSQILSFVFIYILALFRRFLWAKNQRHQRPSPWGEGGESSEPGEGSLRMGLTTRLFGLILCFHIHSGFVPPIL